MSKFQRFYLEEYCYFVTATTINNLPIFAKEENAQILLNCIYNFREKRRLLLLAFVIMSTHFHALLVPDKKYNISQIMHSIKRSSSRLLTNIGEKSGSIWQPSFYEHVVRNKADFKEKIKYIFDNPIRAGLITRPEDYKFSSANYRNETDLNKYWVS